MQRHFPGQSFRRYGHQSTPERLRLELRQRIDGLTQADLRRALEGSRARRWWIEDREDVDG